MQPAESFPFFSCCCSLPSSCYYIAKNLGNFPLEVSCKFYEFFVLFFNFLFMNVLLPYAMLGTWHRLNSTDGLGREGHTQEATLRSRMSNLTICQEKPVFLGDEPHITKRMSCLPALLIFLQGRLISQSPQTKCHYQILCLSPP